jgi:uncharacterized iron-regulated protein
LDVGQLSLSDFQRRDCLSQICDRRSRFGSHRTQTTVVSDQRASLLDQRRLIRFAATTNAGNFA